MLNKEVEFATASINLGQTYGNMTAYIVDFLKAHFPDDYFTNVTVATKIAYKYFDFLNNSGAERVIKRSKPFMVVRPRLEMEEGSKFLDGTYLTQRMFSGYDGADYGNLMPFYRDDNNQLECRFLMNRFRMMFDVVIVVETALEQLNIETYLRNTIVTDRPIIMNCSLESLLPTTVIEGISNISGIPYTDTAKFLDHMNAHSMYPVTYKRANSSGNDEFFRYYPCNVDCTIGNISKDDGSRKGMADDAYTITFTAMTEFNGAGLYNLFSHNKESKKKLRLLGVNKHDLDNTSITDMIFTIDDLYSKKGQGWQTYTSAMFKVERVDKPDKFDFGEIINTTISQSIDYHMEKKIPMDRMIEIELHQDSQQLEEGTDYRINYNKKNVTLFKLKKTSTYRLVININTLYINELIIEIMDREDK